MSVSPAEVQAGDQISATYEGDLVDSRGGYFYLENSEQEPIAGLWTDQHESGKAGYTTDLDRFNMLDFAVSGPGPDKLMTPSGLAPGEYRLCTANSRLQACAKLIIV